MKVHCVPRMIEGLKRQGSCPRTIINEVNKMSNIINLSGTKKLLSSKSIRLSKKSEQVLNTKVIALINKAVLRAKANKRSTLLPQDL